MVEQVAIAPIEEKGSSRIGVANWWLMTFSTAPMAGDCLQHGGSKVFLTASKVNVVLLSFE